MIIYFELWNNFSIFNIPLFFSRLSHKLIFLSFTRKWEIINQFESLIIQDQFHSPRIYSWENGFPFARE